MTRKELLAETARQLGNARDTLKTSKNKAVLTATANKIYYLAAVQAALRGPTKEMVERMRGEWMFPIFGDQQDANDPRCQCSECGSIEMPLARYRFCPVCGAPMTNEAVEMVMERLEALKDAES